MAAHCDSAPKWAKQIQVLQVVSEHLTVVPYEGMAVASGAASALRAASICCCSPVTTAFLHGADQASGENPYAEHAHFEIADHCMLQQLRG